MAYTSITLTNGVEIKRAPIGFSWTTFFFGGFPALIRQDWIWGLGIIVAGSFTYGVAGVICAFFYNKEYIKTLIKQGYTIQSLPSDLTEDELKTYIGFVELPMTPTE